jgi:hypothetical protein
MLVFLNYIYPEGEGSKLMENIGTIYHDTASPY